MTILHWWRSRAAPAAAPCRHPPTPPYARTPRSPASSRRRRPAAEARAARCRRRRRSTLAVGAAASSLYAREHSRVSSPLPPPRWPPTRPPLSSSPSSAPPQPTPSLTERRTTRASRPGTQAEDRPRQKHTWLRELRAWRKTPAGASAQPASFAPLAADALAMIIGPGSCAWSPSIGGRAQTRARRTWARRRRSAPGSCTHSAYFTIRTLQVLDRAGG